MRLVLRRAVRAWGLLLALAAAALVATAAVTLIAGYDRQVTQAGWRTVAASAPPAERSLLITGSADAAEYPVRDAAVRAAFAGGLGGVPVTTAAARYGTGRQLLGDLPPVRASADPVFAALASPADLPAHADLSAGAWPQPGRDPVQVTLPQSVASTLDVTTGSRIAVRDRATGRGSQMMVSGLWRPRDPQDPYWLLTPELSGAPATSHGPFVPADADFDRMVAGTTTSARWVVQPALTTAGPAGIAAARRALDPTVRNLPAQTGLGSSALVTTGLDRLADRIARANAVGRSSMAIPLALVVILGLCVLIRVAALLDEDRRPQTELLRARGASRGQLAGLAAGEAALTVTWAALLAPVAALLATSRLDPHPRAAPALWLVAGVVAAGCLLAMLGPATLARPDRQAGGTRARRWAPAQRAGVDLLLVALAVLAWTQARQYSGAGSGPQVLLDPSLPAAPVLGVLAGAALALRVLPPLTAYAQRWSDRPRWPAATLGAWNAGRRTHTAQMLVLALAVGAGTLAWSFLATVDRSHAAQAAHEVGADLRLRDTDGSAARAAQLSALPGVRTVTPAWRDDIRIGSDDVPATVIATAGVGGPAVRSGVALPPDAVRLSGVVGAAGARVTALVSDANGLIVRVTLPAAGPFSVALPAGPLHLAGVDTDARAITLTALRVTRPDGSAGPVDLRGAGWTALSGRNRTPVIPATAGELRARSAGDAPAHLTVVAQPSDRPVPAVVTPDILHALDAKVSDTVPLALPDADLTIQVIGVRPALPGGTAPAAILLDLPAAADRALFATGTVRPYPEWRIATEPARHAGAAAAAAALPGISVVDRVAVQRAADRDPYWLGVRTGLLAAVLSAVVLALVGYGVDMGIGLRRRAADQTVLRRLGAGSALLSRAFLVEQGLVAGAGAIAGLAIGVLVSALTVPLAVLTPAAARPVPAPALVLPWGPIAALAAGLPAAILLLSWTITLRRRP